MLRNWSALEIEAESPARVMANGSFFLASSSDREHHADRLRQHRRDGRTSGVHAEARHQDEVARDVDDAGHQHKKQRRAAVAKAAEDGGEQVIGDDEEDPAAADAHIAWSSGRRPPPGACIRTEIGRAKPTQQDKHPHGENGEHDRRTAEDSRRSAPAVFRQGTAR